MAFVAFVVSFDKLYVYKYVDTINYEVEIYEIISLDRSYRTDFNFS